MKLLPSIFYTVEVGSARWLVRLIPLVLVVLGIMARYDVQIYKGLNDMSSMDNAQLARQLERQEGFSTYFIRPYALTQVNAYKAKQGQTEMFPASVYTSEVPRAIPDTYNAPGFPLVLASFFRLMHVDFDEPNATTLAQHAFGGDRWIPVLNGAFILLTAGLMFLLGWRLFDDRVAWMGSVAFLASELVWNYSLTALPTNLLMFLITALFFAAVEISRIAEEKFDENNENSTFGWAWLIVPGMAVLIGVMSLNSLLLLVLVLPFIVFLMLMRSTNWFFPVVILGVVGFMVAPWFYHWYRACGNPLGSNLTLGRFGVGDYTGNQIYCATTLPTYNGLVSDFGAKQYAGFLYYFQHGWSLLGSHPLVLLFAASILHEFRRRRVQAFRWLVIGCAFAIVFATNLGNPQPDAVGDWNLVAILLPAMILIGTAFFFTLLDRLTTQLPLFTVTLVVATLALTVTPMAVTLTFGGGSYYNYPPYLPPALSYVAKLAPTDQWVTTDVPWATAWYGDHTSLWVPDSVTDFTNINDNICESALILFTPKTLGKPATNLTAGEQKDWLPYVLGLNIPDTFPLHRFGRFPGVSDYILISNAR